MHTRHEYCTGYYSAQWPLCCCTNTCACMQALNYEVKLTVDAFNCSVSSEMWHLYKLSAAAFTRRFSECAKKHRASRVCERFCMPLIKQWHYFLSSLSRAAVDILGAYLWGSCQKRLIILKPIHRSTCTHTYILLRYFV